MRTALTIAVLVLAGCSRGGGSSGGGGGGGGFCFGLGPTACTNHCDQPLLYPACTPPAGQMCFCETVLPRPDCAPFNQWICYPLAPDLSVPDLNDSTDLLQPVDGGASD